MFYKFDFGIGLVLNILELAFNLLFRLISLCYVPTSLL